MSRESDAAFFDWAEGHHVSAQFDEKSGWDAALAWSRPLVAAALAKAKASRTRTPKEPSTFVPPTHEQIVDYMREQGFDHPGERAEAYRAYYETRGWVPSGSRTRMKSWKAAVRTWKIHNFPVNGNNRDHTSTNHEPHAGFQTANDYYGIERKSP